MGDNGRRGAALATRCLLRLATTRRRRRPDQPARTNRIFSLNRTGARPGSFCRPVTIGRRVRTALLEEFDVEPDTLDRELEALPCRSPWKASFRDATCDQCHHVPPRSNILGQRIREPECLRLRLSSFAWAPGRSSCPPSSILSRFLGFVRLMGRQPESARLRGGNDLSCESPDASTGSDGPARVSSAAFWHSAICRARTPTRGSSSASGGTLAASSGMPGFSSTARRCTSRRKPWTPSCRSSRSAPNGYATTTVEPYGSSAFLSLSMARCTATSTAPTDMSSSALDLAPGEIRAVPERNQLAITRVSREPRRRGRSDEPPRLRGRLVQAVSVADVKRAVRVGDGAVHASACDAHQPRDRLDRGPGHSSPDSGVHARTHRS